MRAGRARRIKRIGKGSLLAEAMNAITRNSAAVLSPPLTLFALLSAATFLVLLEGLLKTASGCLSDYKIRTMAANRGSAESSVGNCMKESFLVGEKTLAHPIRCDIL